jgi:type II secretory pathway component GspD/PulD (secretin)
MQKVRELLSRMGESVTDPTEQESRRIRTIPFYGDVENTMRRLQELWPQLHSNQLHIIYPTDYDGGRLLKTLPSSDPLDDKRRAVDSTQQNATDVSPIPSPTPLPMEVHQVDNSADETPETQPAAKLFRAAETGRTSDQELQPPPIVVVPGEGKLTISSNDPEALNEFESLLRMFAAPERSPATDVAIFGLRNASAVDTAQLLEKFFKEIPTWGRLGNVIVVPDARLNAVIVHASRPGREAVREILSVLDAGDDDSRTKFNKPRIVPVLHSSAARILTILQTLYETQLTSGAGRRKPIDIPSGVDADVAAILEQLNASSAGPLLTLEVDMATNTIIILGPQSLAEEVTNLIGQLDQRADQDGTRGIRVISLKNMRSELLGEVLNELQASD